jgi:hypothetical protein
VWSGAMVAIAEQMNTFIEDEERSKFVESVTRDIHNRNYRLYYNM